MGCPLRPFNSTSFTTTTTITATSPSPDVMEFIVTAQSIAQQIAPPSVTVATAVQVWQSTWEALAAEVEQDVADMTSRGDLVGANAALARAATYLQVDSGEAMESGCSGSRCRALTVMSASVACLWGVHVYAPPPPSRCVSQLSERFSNHFDAHALEVFNRSGACNKCSHSAQGGSNCMVGAGGWG